MVWRECLVRVLSASSMSWRRTLFTASQTRHDECAVHSPLVKLKAKVRETDGRIRLTSRRGIKLESVHSAARLDGLVDTKHVAPTISFYSVYTYTRRKALNSDIIIVQFYCVWSNRYLCRSSNSTSSCTYIGIDWKKWCERLGLTNIDRSFDLSSFLNGRWRSRQAVQTCVK